MTFKPEDLIINREDLVRPGQKLTAWGITLVFWGALLYLWQPLLSLIAWGLNIELFYHHMILLGGYRSFASLLATYLSIIALLGGGLILWARINQWRFRGKERRQGHGDTDHLKLCESFGVAPEEVNELANSLIIAVDFGPDGKITKLVSRQ